MYNVLLYSKNWLGPMMEAKWELIEVLYVFLLPFKCVTIRFECNKERLEIDYTV